MLQEETADMKNFTKNLLKHKKPIIIFAFVAVICAAVYADVARNAGAPSMTDYIYNSSESTESTKILGEAKLVDTTSAKESEETPDSYFTGATVNRERSRDEALQTLQVVVDSAESMPDVKDKALSEMMQIATDIETEANVEEMIKAKGFEDCLAVISGDNINVIVKSPGLLTAEVAQITEIVKEETGLSAQNIKIVEKM